MNGVLATSTRLCGAVVAAAILASAQDSNVILKAMRDELERARSLQVTTLEKPYFISYAITDGEVFSASAMLGGLMSSTRERLRVPEVAIRVGSYQFDNSNFAGGAFRFGGRSS